MSLFDWLQKRLASDDHVELKPTHVEKVNPDDKILFGLNLTQVLDAHSAWRIRLEAVLKGTSTEELDVSIVAQDSYCVLGKWLYGPGKKSFSHLPEWEVARRAHAEFHLCAAEVLTEYQDDNLEAAQKLLKQKFRTASNKNQLELVRLFTAAKVTA